MSVHLGGATGRFRWEVDLESAGKEFTPRSVVMEFEFAGILFRLGDDGSKIACVAIGVRLPRSDPRAFGGTHFPRFVIGNGLLPLLFEGAATAKGEQRDREKREETGFHFVAKESGFRRIRKWRGATDSGRGIACFVTGADDICCHT